MKLVSFSRSCLSTYLILCSRLVIEQCYDYPVFTCKLDIATNLTKQKKTVVYMTFDDDDDDDDDDDGDDIGYPLVLQYFLSFALLSGRQNDSRVHVHIFYLCMNMAGKNLYFEPHHEKTI